MIDYQLSHHLIDNENTTRSEFAAVVLDVGSSEGGQAY